MKNILYCKACGHVGQAQKAIKGSFLMEIFLWLLFIIPGLLYSLWRLTTKARLCELCGSVEIIPVESPIARSALGGTTEKG